MLRPHSLPADPKVLAFAARCTFCTFQRSRLASGHSWERRVRFAMAATPSTCPLPPIHRFRRRFGPTRSRRFLNAAAGKRKPTRGHEQRNRDAYRLDAGWPARLARRRSAARTLLQWRRAGRSAFETFPIYCIENFRLTFSLRTNVERYLSVCRGWVDWRVGF